MYYQESDILLRMNPEYERYIIKLDELLGSMGCNEGKQLKLDIVSDITGIKPEIIEFIFNYYCNAKILNVKKFIVCPIESVFLDEIDCEYFDKFPIIKFCDICGIEHKFTKNDTATCYAINRNGHECAQGKKALEEKIKPSNEKMEMKSREDPIASNPDRIIIEKIFISEETKKIIKIATVQLNYSVSEFFPFIVKDKEIIRKKIDTAIKKAVELSVDIICFSELCICEKWINDIESKYPNIAIIAGTYYDKDNYNICKLLIDPSKQIPGQIKITPSESESKVITGIGMSSGDRIYIYETKLGKISILICRDFGIFIEKIANKTDIVFVPSYNSSPDRFEDTAHNYVSNHPSYIIISNTAIYGGTSIYGQMDRAYFNRLVQAGYKEKDSANYKLCEIKKGKEGIIVADFNIKFKGIQKPSPIHPDEVIRNIINIRRYDL